MEIKEISFDQCLKYGYPLVAAIGNFDGIHLAHLELIKKAKEVAQENDFKLGIISFDITPRKVVNDINNYFILKNSQQKIAILEELGVDVLFIIKFDFKIKELSAQQFIDDIIAPLNVKYLVCGFDFSFGKDKEGDVDFLNKQSIFKTIVIPRQDYNNKKIGSTYIHELIMNGDIEEANHFLMTPYSIIGTVVQGNQRGRTIGFPTANIAPCDNYRIPGNGVYATKIKVGDICYWSMTNIGHNPTFNYRTFPSIETNIFGFNQMIYCQEVELFFYKRIRKEKIFEDINTLIEQLSQDQYEVIKYFQELENE